MKKLAWLALLVALPLACNRKKEKNTSDIDTVKQSGPNHVKKIEKPAELREKAIAAIKQLGGEVRVRKTDTGEASFSVVIHSRKFTDAGLVHLKALTNLEWLYLSGKNITDNGLVHLEGLTKLRHITLRETRVTVAGMKTLHAKLPNCRIHGTKPAPKSPVEAKAIVAIEKFGGHVTAGVENGSVYLTVNVGRETPDAALAHLKDLVRIQWLSLSNSKVSDAGLAHLQELNALRVLHSNHTKVSGKGLGYLSKLTELRKLHLTDTKISDDGLAHLKGLTKLEMLLLDRSEVTDAGLDHLMGLTGLRRLNLAGTKVTDVGVKKLQAALPNCRIVR